jgi:hypothetical protein
MNIQQLGATGALILIIFGLMEIIKALILKRRNNSFPKGSTRDGSRPVSQLDCLKTQQRIEKTVTEKFDGFRSDLQASLSKINKGVVSGIRRHEDTFHFDEVSGSRRSPFSSDE